VALSVPSWAPSGQRGSVEVSGTGCSNGFISLCLGNFTKPDQIIQKSISQEKWQFTSYVFIIDSDHLSYISRWAWVVNCAHLSQRKTCPSFSRQTGAGGYQSTRCESEQRDLSETDVKGKFFRADRLPRGYTEGCKHLTKRCRASRIWFRQPAIYLIDVCKCVVCLSVLVWYPLASSPAVLSQDRGELPSLGVQTLLAITFNGFHLLVR